MSATRPTVLTFASAYLPGYKAGGPIRTIANMVDRLNQEFAFKVITADRDLGDALPYEGLELDCWVRIGSAEVMYVSRNRQTLRGFAQMIRGTPHDVIYLNSFFGARFSLLPLLARRMGLVDSTPAVLAPRGELDSGALALKSFKKRAFISVTSLAGLYSGLAWQASSALEAERILRIMKAPSDSVFIAPDLPALAFAGHFGERSADEHPFTIAFLSRISRKKNLDYALRTLLEVQAPCVFAIYGMIEDRSYWDECQRLIASLPVHVQVEYRGEVPHDQVHQALSGADLFFFPTRGENYGHVILEALSAGVPVLISDQTPWGDLSSREVGWTLPLSGPQGFADVIDACANETADSRLRRRMMAREYARDVVTASDAIDANIRMFLEVIRSARGLPRGGS